MFQRTFRSVVSMRDSLNKPGLSRVYSIDAFRAVTMLLMIWVNDFWSLIDIPHWLQHMAAEDDALGFSDVIFPAFLFIVGLSIPYAIEQRRLKGDINSSILRHIIERSFALLLMGFFMVNLESLSAGGLTKWQWQALMTLSFFLIWNIYPKKPRYRFISAGLRTSGYLILILLAIVYQGPGDPAIWMKPYWWGILGLIGWAYLYSSIIYLFWGHRWPWMIVAWAFFALFNILDTAGWLNSLSGLRNYLWISGSGSNAALTMAGVVVSSLYLQVYKREDQKSFLRILLLAGAAVLVFGFVLRPLEGISKIRATPSWTELCTGISILSYAILFWIVDMKGKKAWMKLIQPAGTSTLTCYLIPYFAYAVVIALSLSLPEALRTGSIGLLKSTIFAFLIVWTTGLINRLGIKLKI